jgi:hypothetical protein
MGLSSLGREMSRRKPLEIFCTELTEEGVISVKSSLLPGRSRPCGGVELYEKEAERSPF